MRRFSITTWITLTLTAAACWANQVDVFILAGQSNMVGAGNTNEAPADLLHLVAPQPDVLAYQLLNPNKQNPFYTTDGWVDLAPRDVGTTNFKFGPELSFGRTIADALPDRDIAIFKFAENGTSLATSWHPDLVDELYDQMMREWNAARDDLIARGHNPRVAGFVWVQGSGDAGHLDRAEAYDENLNRLIEQLRIDTDTADLPVIFNRYHMDANKPYVAELRTSQMGVADGDMRAVITNADDFSLKIDRMHYTSDSHLLQGIRLAEAYLAYTQLLGDANNDGQTTGADLIGIQHNFGGVGPADGLLLGDANDDGQVTGADLISVQQHFGSAMIGVFNGVQTGSVPATGSVPEPAAFSLLGIGAWLLLRRVPAHAR